MQATVENLTPTVVDNLPLQITLDAETHTKAEAVNNALMKIELMAANMESLMQYTEDSLRQLGWAYDSKPRDAEGIERRREAISRALSQIASWHKGCLWVVFASEYTLYYTPERKLGKGHRARAGEQIERFLNRYARIIHQMLQSHPDREVERMMAEYAIYLSHLTGCSLGPVGDLRYKHPDKAKWARIKARAVERLANLVKRDVREKVGDVAANRALAEHLKRTADHCRALAKQADSEAVYK